MTNQDDTTIADQKPDPPWLADVEALSLEICAELREIVEMLTTYRQTIATAARLIAQTHASPLVGGPEAAEMARELAQIVHIEAEIEKLLPPSKRE